MNKKKIVVLGAGLVGSAIATDLATDYEVTARTTGFTCTALVHLMLDGNVEGHGIIPPERVAQREKNFTFILQYLKERNVNYVLQKQ